MMRKIFLLWVCLAVVLGACGRAESKEASEPAGAVRAPAYTDVAVLTTTDLHGKCWHTNLLTDAAETNNMLRVSTAVRRFRQKYGEENVLLLDNGDLFQGTPVSEVRLTGSLEDGPDIPPAMAVCLKEIGYDAFSLGNHEFDFSWKNMQEAYRYLEENGIPVLSANICHDGTDGQHQKGENAFTPYTVKTISVNGHEHKIGILGLNNPDTVRWETPDKYPGLLFSHPENAGDSMAYEAGLYIPRMKEEGCEFIITTFHSGLGSTDEALAIGKNTDCQGKRLAEESEDINLLVLGHDHTSGYSNTTVRNRKGKEIPVVNGGGQELTETVFRFSETESGSLTWEMTESSNLKIGDYEIDRVLEAKIAPYAEIAEKAVSVPLGTVTGDWDESAEYFLKQTDTIDLVSAAQIAVSTKRIAERFREKPIEGRGVKIDHPDVDMTISGVAVSGDFVVKPGDITKKDTYQLYRHANRLAVLPMFGYEIQSIMEENAAQRLTARVYSGEAHFFTKNEVYTNLIFGGLNFVCDLSKPEGERIRISGFANGKPFNEKGLYLVATTDYLLGNDKCGLREFGLKDAIWFQSGDSDHDHIQDIIAEYIEDQCGENGSLTPDAFSWKWSLEYSEDPGALPASDKAAAASLKSSPRDGHTYVIYSESERCLPTAEERDGSLLPAALEAYGEILPAPLPEDTLTVTAHAVGSGQWTFTDPEGRYLSCKAGGGLQLTAEESADAYSRWISLSRGATVGTSSAPAETKSRTTACPWKSIKTNSRPFPSGASITSSSISTKSPGKASETSPYRKHIEIG